MKGKFLLASILFYAALSRLFIIDKIPPVLNTGVINFRMMSVTATLVSTILLFFLVKNSFRNTKTAMLSAWAFNILPWVFEQGRLVSGPNLSLTLILFTAFFIQNIRFRWKYALIFLIPVFLYLIYPHFWVFRTEKFILNADSIVNNLFILFSFDLLFFKNITFWFGGIREFGIMLLSFLPFFMTGIYLLIIQKKTGLILLYTAVAAVSALSPFFPESREFYFATPIISIMSAVGISNWTHQQSLIKRLILVSFILFMLYEIFQFYHFYFVHYPQQDFTQIHDPF